MQQVKSIQNIFQLNIVARAPLDLMAQSKEIVLQHQQLKQSLRDVAASVIEAEQRNQQLLQMCRERDEQCLHSGTLQKMVIGIVPTTAPVLCTYQDELAGYRRLVRLGR